MLDYDDAKLKIMKTCHYYIYHNKQQLKKLIGKSSTIVGDVDNEGSGIKNWFNYHYAHFKRKLSRIESKDAPQIWQEKTRKYDDKTRKKNDDPKLVLQRLKLVIQLLNGFFEESKKNNPESKVFQTVINKSGFREKDFKYNKGAPISTKLYLSVQHISALSGLLFKLANNHVSGNGSQISIFKEDNDNVKRLSMTASNFRDLRDHVNNYFHPEFNGFLKYIAVKELIDTLNTPNLTEQKQLKCFESQINRGCTQDILYKNRQSQTEYYLKILSIISIFIGVGIFTTLGLTIKRLYDTGGTSINFFKPLTVDLSEDANSILNDTISLVSN
jgi:hypothetical protein